MLDEHACGFGNTRKEHIMDWLLANWLSILLGIAFVAMHMFMHGGHGGHGGYEPDSKFTLAF